jgi:hypothetical protein
VKLSFMVAFLPGIAIIFGLSVVVYLLFPGAYLTLYSMDGLFNPEINVSWLYPLIVLLSIGAYPLTGWLYAQFVKAHYLATLEPATNNREEPTLPPSPVTGGALMGVVSALFGTFITFPLWLFWVWQEHRTFVIIYDDGLSELGYAGIFIAGIFRHWGLNLVLGGIFGAVFGALGALLVSIPPPDNAGVSYDPQ